MRKLLNRPIRSMSRTTSLKAKLTVFFSLVVVVIAVVLSLSFFYQTRKTLIESFKNRGSLLALNLAYNGRYGVFVEDRQILHDLMEGVLQVEEVVYVLFQNQEGKILGQKLKEGEGKNLADIYSPEVLDRVLSTGRSGIKSSVSKDGREIYDFMVPVFSAPFSEKENFPMELLEERGLQASKEKNRKMRGWVRMGMSSHQLERQVRRMFTIGILIASAMMMAGTVLIYFLAQFYIRPLETLASIAQKVASGDLTQNAPVRSGDEIGKLTTLFNQMTASLFERDREIRERSEDLNRLNKQLTDMNLSLEERVFKRTIDLETALRQVETEKKKTERIIHEITDGVIVTDVDGRILLINPAARRMLLGGSERIPSSLSSFSHLPQLRDLFKDPGEVRSQEIQVYGLEEVSMTLKTTTAPFKDEEGRLLGKIGVFHDITRFKEIDRLKSEFVSHVSHEIRTPLTSIKGYIDNLRDGAAGELNQKQRAYLERMYQNADRLIRLISDLLDLSRIESGKMRIALFPVSIPDLIDDVIGVFRPIAIEKGLQVTVVPFDGEGKVLGDRDKLEQVVINLIDNAIKFTPSGGQITVSLKETAGEIAVSIQDTGIGIPLNEQPRIFDRFYRVEKTSDAVIEGTGLGLFISKTLIEMHGGEIWVMSEKEGAGSEFRFILPRRPVFQDG
ncbi:MAG: ATP-binding protein [Candidatus Manganitrophaceae bacterium]